MQADGWPDGVLIMATLVYWEATLCSRSMGAKEWRSLMTWVLCPGTRYLFKDAEIFNISSVICTRLSYSSSDFKRFICIAGAIIMDHEMFLIQFSNYYVSNILVVSRLVLNVRF